MATLTGNAINTSYQGLIKTVDNTALPAIGTVQLTDGEGNLSVLELGQQSAVMTNGTLYAGNAAIASDVTNDQFVFLGTLYNFEFLLQPKKNFQDLSICRYCRKKL